VNKQGQTRLANYYEWMPIDERNAMEAEIIRKCLSRTENQCSFMEYRGMKVRALLAGFLLADARGRGAAWGLRGVARHRAAWRGAARRGAAIASACCAVLLPPPPPSRAHGAPVPQVIYRRYASLFFIVGVEVDEENELGILEFIHALVETLDKYFENVCELDIMFNLEKAHFILDEMVTNGCIMETNKGNILKPILWLEKRVRARAMRAACTGAAPLMRERAERKAERCAADAYASAAANALAFSPLAPPRPALARTRSLYHLLVRAGSPSRKACVCTLT
jgi:hypothetical protein